MNRLLVTGASGFIGRAVLAAVDPSRYETHATCFSKPPPQTGNVRWHELNLFDSQAVSALVEHVEPTHLLHLAWYMRERDHLYTTQNLQWVAASLHLVERFAAHGGQRAVFAGTYAEYGLREGLMEEEGQPAPVSLYAVCKDALHRIIAAYAPAAGLSYAWARIFTVYGPGDAPYRLIPYAIDALLDGREVLATEGRQVRDFVYVDDVASALSHLVGSAAQGVFNIGSGNGHAVRETLEAIAQTVGQPGLLQLGARAQAPGETQETVASVRRLRADGWSPKYDLRSGLAAMVASARSEKDGKSE